MSMRVHTQKVDQQVQQGREVATMTAPQLPALRYAATSYLYQRARAQVTALESGIAQQPSKINGYFPSQSAPEKW